MTFEVWLSFALASAAVVLIPGPNIVLTINYALTSGKRTGWATVPGVVLGAFVAMTLSLAGAGAILATSAHLFTALKIAGALYLVWLAYKLWTSSAKGAVEEGEANMRSLRSIFAQSFLVSVLNPKGPIFYVAFVPQFVSVSAPIFEQFALLIATFLFVAFLNSLMWLFFATSLRERLSKPSAMRIVNRTGATCLSLAAVLTASATRV